MKGVRRFGLTNKCSQIGYQSERMTGKQKVESVASRSRDSLSSSSTVHGTGVACGHKGVRRHGSALQSVLLWASVGCCHWATGLQRRDEPLGTRYPAEEGLDGQERGLMVASSQVITYRLAGTVSQQYTAVVSEHRVSNR